MGNIVFTMQRKLVVEYVLMLPRAIKALQVAQTISGPDAPSSSAEPDAKSGGTLQLAIEDTGVRLRVEQAAGGGVVVEPHLRHLELRVDGHLERVLAKVQLADVHPLAVDVVPVDVGAVDRDALVAVVGARVPRLHARQALVVLEAEGGLVALGHPPPARIDHVERREHLHAVVVHVAQVPLPQLLGDVRPEVGGARVDHARRELEQPARLQVPVGVLALDLVRLRRHAVLLHGALQQVHQPVLQVQRLLQLDVVEHQVGHLRHARHRRHVPPPLAAPRTSPSDRIVATVGQRRLVPVALRAAQQQLRQGRARFHALLRAREEVRLDGIVGVAQPELPADDIAFEQAPSVAAHASPGTGRSRTVGRHQAYLHAALVRHATSDQPQLHRSFGTRNSTGTGFSVVAGSSSSGRLQITPAASLASQSFVPQPSKWQSASSRSFPPQYRLSIQNLRFARPKWPVCVGFRWPGKPSCRQTTSASAWSHSSSQIAPHRPLRASSSADVRFAPTLEPTRSTHASSATTASSRATRQEETDVTDRMLLALTPCACSAPENDRALTERVDRSAVRQRYHRRKFSASSEVDLLALGKGCKWLDDCRNQKATHFFLSPNVAPATD
uniref:Uncharacterized protein n=1 Tax=Anopheles atroparvus TaxID=41427 RepID=A0A182JIT0_ANOAO